MIGETIDGRYLLEAVLSSGYAGTVYQAAEISSGEQVAIRFIESLADPARHALSRQLQAEFQALAALDHLGLEPVYGYGLYGGVPYLVIAYPDGVPLTREVELAPLSMERAVHTSHEIGQLLVYLHEHGIVHGDLRPANVILTPTWDLPHVRLTGFGSTPAQDLSGREDEDLVYLAPEQIQGKQPDIRSDLYSLGAILYALSTGHLPSPVADMLATSQTPSQLNAKIPTSLEHLILELLDSDAESRPHNAELVVARLQQIGQNDLFPPDEPMSSDEPQLPGPPSWEL